MSITWKFLSILPLNKKLYPRFYVILHGHKGLATQTPVSLVTRALPSPAGGKHFQQQASFFGLHLISCSADNPAIQATTNWPWCQVAGSAVLSLWSNCHNLGLLKTRASTEHWWLRHVLQCCYIIISFNFHQIKLSTNKVSTIIHLAKLPRPIKGV